ncbi:hypothetical protein ABW19_dt0202465 [Dactylella cylindrospora]|nr:hypothetical protein ABW19_dt0202465 [Dactylella cylindrospora]
MSDSVTNSVPTEQPTTEPTFPPTTEEPTSTSVDIPTSTTEPPPPSETTTSEPPPPETSTTEPPPTSTAEPPPTTTEEPTTSTPEPTTEPTTESPSSTTSVTVITVTPTESSETTITLTTTSSDPESSSSQLTTSTSSSSTSSSATISATSVPSTGGGGLSQPAKIAIAIIIPIFAVALIAFLGIFFWRRYRKRKDSEEMRRKEVEEYGYNPNKDAPGAGGAILAAGGGAPHHPDIAEADSGYRGWGSTAGGRKASAPLSTGATNTTGVPYGSTGFADAGANGGQPYVPPNQAELYGSPVVVGGAAAAGGAAALGVARSNSDGKQNADRHSNSPLLSSPTQRPSTADSSTIGAAAMNGPSELDDGLHRGDSVASSRYTNATHQSDGSDVNTPVGPNSNRNYQAGGGNDYYNDVANPYANGDYDYQEQGPEPVYQQPPPMIQQVGARRNTRIENPPENHYPQMPRQGTSGIAQNF